jgi:hypothetical protein
LSKKRKRPREEYYDESESEPTAPYRRTPKLAQLLDPAKIAQLVRASTLPIKETAKEHTTPNNYPTYSEERASALVREYLANKDKDGSPKS